MPATEESTTGKPGPRRPSLDTVYSINPDGSRNAIHPADVRGRYQARKTVIWWILIAIYVVVPWLDVGGKPAVLIDIEHRHFYLFGQTFNAQDFWLAFFLLTGVGFTLFVVSALWGRIWCGYACPHTVFLEGVFRTIERWIEGTPVARRKLDAAPWTRGKMARRAAKYAVFLAIAGMLAHTALSYFVPVEEVLEAATGSPGKHPVAFGFVVALTLASFVNFTWFREQLCIVICPYGRLQGVLYDRDTINVGYDRERGEPRGALRGGAGGTTGLGDCVDCYRCVQVCPTGIDIRNGTQLECVGCANCIDACDEVMDRVGRPRGLVRYDSMAGLEGGPRRFLRPRVGLYAGLLVIGCVVFATAATVRTPFQAKLLRDPSTPFTLEEGVVTNSLFVRVVNKQPSAADFDLQVTAPPAYELMVPVRQITLESLASQRVPVITRISRDAFRPGERVVVTVSGGDVEVTTSAQLLGPNTPTSSRR